VQESKPAQATVGTLNRPPHHPTTIAPLICSGGAFPPQASGQINMGAGYGLFIATIKTYG